jgi:hypothetical protein
MRSVAGGGHSEEVRVALQSVLDGRGLLSGEAVLAAPTRVLTRSNVYFLGDSTAPGVCRWVVKESRGGAAQADLVESLTAFEQFSALQRLHDHFADAEEPFGVPRPIAVLPGLDAFAMSYIPGVQVSRLLRPRTVLRPERALDACSSSGALLSRLHQADRQEVVAVDTRRRADHILGLDAAGTLPGSLRHILEQLPGRTLRAPAVRLHGDFAPVNVIIGEDGGTFTFDIDHQIVDTPEHDIARFLVMLQTDRLFTMAVDAPAVERLRQRLERAFLDGYQAPRSADIVLHLEVVEQLLRRWTTRRQLLRATGTGRLKRGALDRRFATLLADYGLRLADAGGLGRAPFAHAG